MPDIADYRARFSGDDSGFQAAGTRVISTLNKVDKGLVDTIDWFRILDAELKKNGTTLGSMATMAGTFATAVRNLRTSLSPQAVTAYAGALAKLGKELPGLAAGLAAGSREFGVFNTAMRSSIASLSALTPEAATADAELRRLSGTLGRIRAMSRTNINVNAAGGGQGGVATSARAIAGAKDVGNKMTGYLTVPILAMDAVAGKLAVGFDQSLRNVDSLAKLTGKDFDAMRASVVALANDKRITQGPKELADGLYNVIGSGFKGKEALEVLRQSAYGATAGMTDTATATRVLTAVLNSHIPGVQTAQQAMDVLFKEVDLGVNTFEGLANSIGKTLPSAAAAGVSLQEVAAALVVLTRNGLSAAEANTSVNSLINKIASPAAKAGEQMKKMGIEYGFAALQAKGFTGWLQDALKKTNGNAQALKAIVPEMRAFRGLLNLMNDGLKGYTSALGQTKTASQGAGAQQQALDRQLQGAGAQWAVTRKELELAGITLGTSLLPLIKDATKFIGDLAKSFAGMSESSRGAFITWTLVAAAAGPLIRGLAGVASAAMTVRSAFLGLQAAQATASAAGIVTAGGFAAVATAALPVVATVGLVAVTAYALYRAYGALTAAQTSETSALITGNRVRDEAIIKFASASAASAQNAAHTANLYRQYEILRDTSDRTTQQQDRMRNVMNQIGADNPGLIAAFDAQGNVVRLLAGQYANLAAEADRAGAASLRAANAARIAAVQQSTAAPVIQATDRLSSLDAAKAAAQERLQSLQQRKGLARRLFRRNPQTGEQESYNAVDRGEQYRQALRAETSEINRLTRERAKIAEVNEAAQNKQRAAFRISQMTPKEKADFMEEDYAATPKGSTRTGGAPPAGFNAGGGGKGRAKKAKEATDYLKQWREGEYELQKTLALGAEPLKSASLAYDIAERHLNGYTEALKAGNVATARAIVQMAKHNLNLTYQVEKVEEQKKLIKEVDDFKKKVNEDRRADTIATTLSDEDAASLEAFKMPFAQLKTKFGKGFAAIEGLVREQAARRAKNRAAASVDVGSVDFDNGDDLAKRKKARLTQEKSFDDAIYKQVRLSNRNLARENDASRRQEAIDRAVEDIPDVKTDLGARLRLEEAAGKAYDRDLIINYTRAYEDSMRSMRRELSDYTTMTDDARIATVEFDVNGIRLMTHDQAALVVAMQKTVEKTKEMRDRMKKLAGDIGDVFGNTLKGVFDNGFRGLFASVLDQMKQLLQNMLIEIYKSQVTKWFTKVLVPQEGGASAAGTSAGRAGGLFGLAGALGSLGGLFGGGGSAGGNSRESAPGTSIPSASPPRDILSALIPGLGFFEGGGRFAARQPMVVGERRAELVSFDRSGTVHPSVPGGDTNSTVVHSPTIVLPPGTNLGNAERTGAQAARGYRREMAMKLGPIS